jgi:hypothetical protein
MSENPYAPPQAELGGGAETALGTGDFDFGRCFSEAWARTWANFPLWLGVGVVLLLASAAVSITIVGIFLALPVLMWGGVAFFLKMHDGGAELRDIFSGFSRYGQALAGFLGWWLLSFVVGLISQLPLFAAQLQGSAVAIIGAYAIYIGVTFLVTPRLTMAIFLMVDRGMGLSEALRIAWQTTAPLMWKMAGLMVAMVGVMLAGLIALVIGMIPATVVAYLMWTSAYRQIFGGAPRAA